MYCFGFLAYGTAYNFRNQGWRCVTFSTHHGEHHRLPHKRKLRMILVFFSVCIGIKPLNFAAEIVVDLAECGVNCEGPGFNLPQGP